MGSWWRSADMTHVSVIVSEEAAAESIKELGSLGCIQFVDLNPELTPFQRRYMQYIKRCDEIERKIRYLNTEIQKMGVPVQSAGSIEGFIDKSASDPSSGVYQLELLEERLSVFETQLLDLNKYGNKLTDEYNNKVEYHHLLIKSRKFLGEATDLDRREAEEELQRRDGGNFTHGDVDEVGLMMSPLVSSVDTEQQDGGLYQGDELIFSNIAGVIQTSEKFRFERMVYRATRGNCYVRFSPLSGRAVDAYGNHIDKTCFIIFYKSAAIEGKIKKICEGFAANRYDLANLHRPAIMESIQQQNYRELLDAKTVLDRNADARMKICVEMANSIEEWLWIVRKEKGTYHTLNFFRNDVAGNLLRGRGWILTESIPAAKSALRKAHMAMNLPSTAMMEPINAGNATPPTHFNTNKYTWAFQEFVDTYGVPRYKEANPALFTAATFPFFFGVMYGDIGHGSILTMGALYLILTESYGSKRGLDEMVAGIYSAKYMLFGMGLMAVYAGFIYNDFFSLGLDLFGSRYDYTEQVVDAPATPTGPYGDASNVYPFGVDPAWKISTNELLFFNSMKMKMSVVLGIVQMTIGICLRGINSLYFRNYLEFYTEFLPMIIFAMSLFGYMVVLIFVKWSIDWQERMALGSCNYNQAGTFGACSLDTTSTCYSIEGQPCTANTQLVDLCPLNYGGSGDGCQPPNLITTLINIALTPGVVEEPMFAGQAGLQTFLLLVAFACVPWLLCVKPFYLKKEHEANQQRGGMANQQENPLLGSGSGDDIDAHVGHSHSHGDHGEEFDFGEIFIHQAIETIEFVLGMISNTASYLRLWALSLAHTELATVFWGKAMVTTIDTNNPVMIFFGFAVFASVTFGVLLAMDVLECFLHALRLHWVEFQNKFYKGDGHKFSPFDFKAIIGKAMLDS